jgi:TonB family protein
MKLLVLLSKLLVIVSAAAFAKIGFAEDAAPRRVSHTAAVQSATAKVTPDYSPIARQLKIQGAVQLDAVIAEDGTVERVDIVSGNPVLTRPAADALKKWRFKPFTDGDKPVKVVASFDFEFKL